MKHLLAVRARLEVVTIGIALAGLSGLLALAFLIIADGVLRWQFNQPIDGVADMAQLTLPIAVAATLPAGLLYRQHVTIRFLGKMLGPRRGLWLDALGDAVLLVLFVLLAWRLGVHTGGLKANQEATWVLMLPLWPWWSVTSALVAACVPVQAFHAVVRLAQALSGAPADPADDAAPEFMMLMVDEPASQDAREPWTR